MSAQMVGPAGRPAAQCPAVQNGTAQAKPADSGAGAPNLASGGGAKPPTSIGGTNNLC
jgi:hypothetical protein